MATATVAKVLVSSLPAAPAGQRYKTIRGDKLYAELGPDGNPKLVARSKKNKPKKPVYGMPRDAQGNEVKIPTADSAKDFKLGMQKLKESDFSDILEYHIWCVWYCEQLLQRAKDQEGRISALGNTPAEREAARSVQRAQNQVEKFLSDIASMPAGPKKNALQQAMEDMFSKMMTG